MLPLLPTKSTINTTFCLFFRIINYRTNTGKTVRSPVLVIYEQSGSLFPVLRGSHTRQSRYGQVQHSEHSRTAMRRIEPHFFPLGALTRRTMSSMRPRREQCHNRPVNSQSLPRWDRPNSRRPRGKRRLCTRKNRWQEVQNNEIQKRKRVAGIEPAWPAWKAGALPLSYTRSGGCLIATGRSHIIGAPMVRNAG
jgi:hypothetical protein